LDLYIKLRGNEIILVEQIYKIVEKSIELEEKLKIFPTQNNVVDGGDGSQVH
jgi:hypothetical protein